MKNIKLVICDIDNTILPYGHDDISIKLQSAFKILKNKQIKLLIATGRHYNFIPKKLLSHLDNDYIVTINGACLNSSNGEIISYSPLKLEDLKAVEELCENYEVGLDIKFKNNIVTYHNHQKFIDGYINNPAYKSLIIDDCKNKQYHLTNDLPLGIFLIGDPTLIYSWQAKLPNLIIAQSTDIGFDVFDKNITKAYGIEQYLKINKLSWNDCISFGDAENDIEMLKKAKISVTFNNVKPQVKKVANYISDTCENDGVYKALVHFKII